MNRQGPSKIDWTDYTWNPVSGCKHGCDYCYLNRIPGFNKEPALHLKRLKEPLAIKASRIFVCSSGDLFGEWVPDYWIDAVMDVVKTCPQHVFQFLTKNPKRYWEYRNSDLNDGEDFVFPENAWLGATVDTQKRANETMPIMRYTLVPSLTFISFEPLLEKITVDLEGISWIIIGGKSGSKPFIPPKDWVDLLVKEARKHDIPVFIKDNCRYPETIKEMPKGERENE